jgi:hypothetical protein
MGWADPPPSKYVQCTHPKFQFQIPNFPQYFPNIPIFQILYCRLSLSFSPSVRVVRLLPIPKQILIPKAKTKTPKPPQKSTPRPYCPCGSRDSPDPRPPGSGGWASLPARVAGCFRDWHRVRRCVVSGKVVERNPFCTFATDGLSLNGTHSDVCCPECQFGRTSM